MKRRLSDWIRGLDPHQIGFWCGIIAPLLALAISLKTVRVAARGLEAGLVSLPELYLSEVAGFAAFGLLGHAALGAIRGRRLRSVALVVCQIVALVLGAIELVGHGFYVRTGSAFDASLVGGLLQDVGTNLVIVLTEVSNTYLSAIAIALSVLLVVPWMTRSMALDARDPESTERDAGAASTGAGPTGLQLLGAAMLGALAIAPTPLEPDTWFSRSSTANIAANLGHEIREQLVTYPEVDSPAASVTVARDDGSAANRPTNVAIVVLESVRADATGVYHPDRETTPFLSDLADRSTVAEHAYAIVPHTSKALVAILCGMEPKLSFWSTASHPGRLPARCLPDVLADHGYRTAFFQTSHPYFENQTDLIDNFGFEAFHSMLDVDREAFDRLNYFGWEDDAMLPLSRRWLETRRDQDQPFVATYLTVSSHHPYATPPDFEGAAAPPTDPSPAADEFGKYLDTIRYVDRFTRKLVRQYKQLGLYEDTLFVFVSDHGEAFGEHGLRFHDDVPYQEGIRILTMFHDPSRPDAPDIGRNVSQLDITPTILDRLGFSLTDGQYRGRAFDAIPAHRPVRVQCYLERRCLVRVVDDTKFIYWFGRRPPEVYDLRDDPRERHNLAARFDTLDDWRRDLLDWRRHVNAMYATWTRR